MIDIQKQMEYFDGLSYDEKKLHLLKMLEKIKDKHEVFFNTYNTINSVQHIEESRMTFSYKLIFEVSIWLENHKKATEKELIQKMKIHINKLREEEKIIRKKEEYEADQLLENI